MDLIKYRKKITYTATTTSETLTSDRCHEWRLLPITTETPLGDLYQSHASSLRRTQIDYLQLINHAVNPQYTKNPAVFYWAYLPSQGYRGQNHDVVFAHWQNIDLWVLMTFNHTFFVQSGDSRVAFSTEENALPAVTEQKTQDLIWQWRDRACLETP
jgi:hypothetical protein